MHIVVRVIKENLHTLVVLVVLILSLVLITVPPVVIYLPGPTVCEPKLLTMDTHSLGLILLGAGLTALLFLEGRKRGD